ncbi:MAG: Rossmann-like domain-containing protein [Phycisphaerae bacterium]
MIIDELRAIAIERSANLGNDNFVLRGLWRLNLLFRPNAQERLFEYTVVVAQTLHQGCCYTEEDPVLDRNLLGQDARLIRSSYSSIEIATLDAVYSVFPKRPSRSFVLDGTALEKSKHRARIVVDEVALQLASTSSLKGKTIVNIGVVGNIIRELKVRGATVYATDRDPGLVGTTISDVRVESCDTNGQRIAECDLALVTGMALSTETLDEIMRQCAVRNKKLVIFAETGANFAEEYCRLGVDAVISEPFPFYIFSGVSRIDVYRAEG